MQGKKLICFVGLLGFGALTGYTALSAPPVRQPSGTLLPVSQRPPVTGKQKTEANTPPPSQKSNKAKTTGTASPALFWSFRPVVRPALPPVKNTAWVKSPVDAFVLAEMEKHGLSPAPPAEKRTLIRRVTFDLSGLPPSPEEVANYLQDKSPDAFAKVVDRLLASPRYGERQARHWLDIVRYADSLDVRDTGTIRDMNDMWRYRDWVVDAFNRDMPYSDFIKNQIAGDVLPGAIPGDINIPGTIATGMLAVGNWGNGNGDKPKVLTDIADDQIDVISRTFMGLTIACARCHDHKYDSISTKDYYGMAGIFFSSHILPRLMPNDAVETPLTIPLVTKTERERREVHAAKTSALKQQLNAQSQSPLTTFAQSQLPQTARYLTALWEYRHRPADKAKQTLEAFAEQKGLHPFAMRKWRDYFLQGDYRLMTVPVRHVAGFASIHRWKGEDDTPWLTVNTNMTPRNLGTIQLPPFSSLIHPGPKRGAVIGWRSPMTGNVQVQGGMRSADNLGGDGVVWLIDHRSQGGLRELAAGAVPNGGEQGFENGIEGQTLSSIAVKEGDMLQLLVLPEANNEHDAMQVEFTVSERGGTRLWNLTTDIVENVLLDGKGNPHPDKLGNAAVWHFFDMASSHRIAQQEERIRPAYSRWEQAVTVADLLATSDRKRGLERIEKAAQAFQNSFYIADESSPFWIEDRADWRLLPAPVKTALDKTADALEQALKAAPPPVQYANGVQEGGCPESSWAGFHDAPVHIRGSYLRLGERVPRRFPLILAGNNQKPITQGSGRRELAEWIASPSHPLTARVFVNRLWQQHFGAGIVRTPGNFGMLGERPTHPELLDWLASEFVRQGGSIKRLHRLLLLSATYQQSSSLQNIPAKVRGVVPKSKMVVDPDNRWLSRMPHKRLEAEALRDNLLAVSGKLDTTMGGTAVRNIDTSRRTLYVMTIRSERTGFRSVFDGADACAITDKRTVSTIAPQALFMLNSAFTTEQSHHLALRLLKERPDDMQRIEYAYELLYSRPPTDAERKIGMSFLASARVGQGTATKTPNSEETAWGEYAQILLCANEFLYVD